jgi:tRNA(adenine34) deaminase
MPEQTDSRKNTNAFMKSFTIPGANLRNFYRYTTYFAKILAGIFIAAAKYAFKNIVMASGCPFYKKYPSILNKNDEYFMSMAYNQAIDAWECGESPIGAVAVLDGEIIASAHNSVSTLNDPTAHAEMQVITQAARVVGDWRLNDVTLYVTKEPCPMCSGAIIMSRVGMVVFGVRDAKMGCLGGCCSLQNLERINHRPVIKFGILETECLALIQSFFQEKRQQKHFGNMVSEDFQALETKQGQALETK